jgi:tellurite resistance protein TerB
MFGKLKERLGGGAKKLSGKTDLLEGIAAAAARVASVDGKIDESEVEAVLNALMNHEALSQAFTGSQIETKGSSDELEMAFMIVIDVAMADGDIGDKEKAELDALGKTLGFSLSSYL